MPQSTQSSSTSIGKHGSVCNLSEFLSLFDRQTLPIIGDGNCLFRCFSHIFYCSQEKHFQLRSLIVDFMILNMSLFTAYCHPATVEEHTSRMKRNYEWGTHAEIFAFAIYFKVPVYTAIQSTQFGSPYYWAKFSSLPAEDVIYPQNIISLPPRVNHFEICNINNNHYDVVLTSNNSFPSTAPYVGDTSSSHHLPTHTVY